MFSSFYPAPGLGSQKRFDLHSKLVVGVEWSSQLSVGNNGLVVRVCIKSKPVLPFLTISISTDVG